MSVLNPPAPIDTPPPARPARGIEPGQLLILGGMTYSSYVAMADAIRDRPSVRFTFHRGTLEIMTTSNRHEEYKARLGRLLEVVFDELNVEAVTGGSQTLRSEELEQGFEPDQCYWIANWERVREPFFLWHPDRQPPPDLVIEIEVSRAAVGKLALFAAYRVPEVWRFDGTTLRVHVLRPAGGYEEVAASPTFPGLPVAEIPGFLAPEFGPGVVTFLRSARAWVRRWAGGPTT